MQSCAVLKSDVKRSGAEAEACLRVELLLQELQATDTNKHIRYLIATGG